MLVINWKSKFYEVFFVLFVCKFGYSQFNVDTLSRSITYDEVYVVKKKSSDVIRNKVNEWIALSFKDSKEVIRLDTPKKIIVKGNFLVDIGQDSYIQEYPCYFDMIVSFKNEKYKLEIKDLRVQISEETVDAKNYVLGSLEDYRNFINEMLKTEKDKSKIIFFNKLLDNESEFKAMYKNVKILTDKTIIQFKTSLESISVELFNYVNNNSDTDW